MKLLKNLVTVLLVTLTVTANFVSIAKASIVSQVSNRGGADAKGGGTSCAC